MAFATTPGRREMASAFQIPKARRDLRERARPHLAKFKTERISSKLICDGVVHCPVTKIDESHYVCSPWHLKLIAIGIVFGIYFAAMGVAIGVLCCRPTSGKGRREELAEDQRAKYRRYFISSGSSSRALPRQTSKA